MKFEVPSIAPTEHDPEKEESVNKVVERAETLLSSLDEALGSYNEVTIGERSYEATTPFEQRVARAQRLHEGVSGLLEQVRERKAPAASEQAAVMLEQVVTLYENALMVQADAADLDPDDKKLATFMNKIALALLPMGESQEEEKT